jgi:hypothetical protein
MATPLFLLAAAPLFLAGCAGTPPPGEAKVATGKCHHMTGSLLCSDDGDGPTDGIGSTSVNQAQIYVGGGPSAGGK